MPTFAPRLEFIEVHVMYEWEHQGLQLSHDKLQNSSVCGSPPHYMFLELTGALRAPLTFSRCVCDDFAGQTLPLSSKCRNSQVKKSSHTNTVWNDTKRWEER